MKKKVLMTLMAMTAAVFADKVDPTQNQFCFESTNNVLSKSSYEWDVSVSPGSTTKTAGSTTFRAILGQPFTTVEDWGLADTYDINKSVWQGVSSTNFTYNHTSLPTTKYLYMLVRYFRYGLTLNANDGTSTAYVTNSICYTNSVALPEPEERIGYNFVGWTNEAFTVAIKGTKTGEALGISEDGMNLALFAKWEPQTFTVTFNPNGEGATASFATKPVTYDSTYGELPTATRPDHAFVGWFTDAEAGTQVSNETAVAITDDQTLFAHWSDLYTVTFQSEGGSVYAVSNNLAYGAIVVPPVIEIPVGKRFKGWEYGSTTYAAGANIPVSQNMTLTSVFESMKTDVSYSCEPADGGNVQITGEKYGDYGRTVTLIATPKGDRYAFAGWSDGEMEATYVVSVIADTNLVAHFSPKSFTVGFFDLDGTTPLCEPQTVEYGEAATAPGAPTHDGVSFVGWSLDFSNVTNDMSVVAQYEANRYTVAYDANGGSGSMEPDVFTYGTEYALQSNAFARAMHAFAGWASTPDATTNEIEYADGAIVSNLTTVANGTNTLYAVWQSVLSDLSTAVDCTNLVLTCGNADQRWVVDNTAGYKSGSSVKTEGNRISKMAAESAGSGTVTFWAKTVSPAKLLFNEKPQDGISTDGEWKCYSFELAATDSFLWQGTMYDDDDAVCWVDQIHWYPDRFVKVESTKVSEDEKNAIMESILQNWDVLLGDKVTGITTAEATGADVTNAVALIEGGVMPDVAVEGSTATLTFRNDGEVRKVPVDVPDVASVEYAGDLQTAVVPDSTLYEVMQNEGGVTAGVYSVVLALKDTERYCWTGGDSNPTSLTFTITQAANAWKVEPSMAGWTYGETPSEPNLGEAKFGTVAVTYGASGAEPPSEPGNYVATFAVEETDNYAGLSKEVQFTIAGPAEKSALEKAFADLPVTLEEGGVDGWKVTFTNAIDSTALPVEIPDNLGAGTIDFNGHDLVGGEGQPAIRVKPGEGDGDPTVLTVKTSGGDAAVQGGEGAPAIEVADGAKDGVKVNVGAGVTLKGGGVPAIDEAVIGTNEGTVAKIDVAAPTIAEAVYTGELQKAVVPDSTLYTVAQNDGGVTAGVYSVTLTLSDTNSYCWAGGDAGSLELPFTILQKDIAGAKIVLGPSLKYTGEEQTQTVQNVTIDGLDVTYTVSGDVATEAGSYTLTVAGTGNFTGSATAAWTIYPDLPPSPWTTDGAYNPQVANVYDGYILEADGSLAGIVQVKAAKQAVKTATDRATGEKTTATNVAVTATVVDAARKKWSYSKGAGTVDGVVTGLVCTTKGVVVSAFGVALGANGLSGEWGDLVLEGARNGMGVKGDAMMGDLEAHYKKSWSATFTNELGATRLQLVVGAKGATKISGVTADGFKVSATVQGIMGEEAFFVPYLATLKSGKLSRPVNLLLTLGQDGAVDVRTSDLGGLKSGGPTSDEIEIQPYAESEVSKGGEAYAGAVVLNDLAYPAKFAAKGLPSGLKIDAATGAITGTPTKPGRYTATITVTSGINGKKKVETAVAFKIGNYTDDLIPVEDAYGDYCVGVKVSEPIGEALGCKVNGLPAGLKFAAKETKDKTFGTVPAGTVYGIPTKAGEYTVYFKKTEKVNGKSENHQASATFRVAALPAWAQGAFDGAVQDLGAASPSGLVSFTVSAAGKVSGKLLRDGLTWTLAAAAYDAYDAGNDEYVATVEGKSGKLAFTNEVTVSAEAFGDSVRGRVTGDRLAAWQNLWKTEPWKTEAKAFGKAPALVVGEVKLKFAASGAVAASGKFVTGQDARNNDVVHSASCSSVLIPQDGNAYTVFLYFPPKDGKFDGYAAEVPLVWDGAQFSLGE